MTSTHLLEAFTDIDNRYILSAQETLGYLNPQPKHRRLRSRLILIAAVIALVAASFTTAMAVNPAFREAVFSFFGIPQSEIIPDLDPFDEIEPDSMEVEDDKIDIGGVIEGTYIHYPMQSHARNGIFMVCTDEVMMNSGNHYDAYYEENGEFIKLEERTFSQDYHILGNDIHMEFEWVEHNGNVSYTYVDSDVPFRKPNLAGDVTATLFTLEIALPSELGYTSYPVLINVETGEVTDICAGTGVENLPGLYQAAISEDLSKLLLVDRDENIYYVDLNTRQLYRVDDLAGEHVEKCSLISDTLACWVLESDSIEEGKLGTYRAWAIDLNTFERKELFSGIPATAATSHDVWSNTYGVFADAPEAWDSISGGLVLAPLTCEGLHFIDGFNMTSHWGNMYAGSTFAIEVNLDRTVYVIDLATGEKSIVKGFLWPDMEYPYITCSPSADGEKLLIYTRTMEGYYGSIGVLDFSRKSYTEFSRQNLGKVNEHTIYWFDNESIIVDTKDDGNSKDYYIYRLLP